MQSIFIIPTKLVITRNIVYLIVYAELLMANCFDFSQTADCPNPVAATPASLGDVDQFWIYIDCLVLMHR